MSRPRRRTPVSRRPDPAQRSSRKTLEESLGWPPGYDPRSEEYPWPVLTAYRQRIGGNEHGRAQDPEPSPTSTEAP